LFKNKFDDFIFLQVDVLIKNQKIINLKPIKIYILNQFSKQWFLDETFNVIYYLLLFFTLNRQLKRIG
jgi:hypothetical protein